MFRALRAHRNRPVDQAGITLIELIVTIAVISLVAAIAVPVFSNVLSGATNSAVSDKQQIVDKFAAEWTSGHYYVATGTGAYAGSTVAFSDTNNNGILDGTETVIAKVPGSLAQSLAPTGLATAASSATSFNISWNAPGYVGSLAVDHYVVRYSTSPDMSASPQSVATTSDVTHATVSGLVPGATYYVQVAAASIEGTIGEYSSPSVVVLATMSGAPTNLTVTAPTATSITASWTAPAATSTALTSYRIQIATNSAFTTDAQVIDTNTAALSKTFTGLSAGTTYYVKVAATNMLGTGAYTAAAFASTSSTPGAPTSLVLGVASGTSLTADWNAPASDGGAAVSSYRLSYATSSDFSTGLTVVDTGSNGTFKTLAGLTVGTTYYVKVAATNAVGTGTVSATASKAPVAAPSAPTDVTATLTGVSTVSVDWSAPTANGSTVTGYSVTGYTVTASPAGPVATISGTRATLTGLVPGTDYTFTVTATNAFGTSNSSATSNTVTAADAPSAPTGLAVAVASSTSLSADWNAPASDNGDAITSYRVTYSTSADFSTGTTVIDTGSTSTAKTLTGLTAGTTYYVKVAATNGVGTGTASGAASKAPAAGPAAPAAPVAALTGLTTASLDWTAPAANGSTITGYAVTVSPAGPTAVVTGTSAAISGLVAGTDYTFTVTATNTFGTSSASAASNTVTAADAPAAPTGLAVTVASSTSVTADWNAPVSDNGDAVTSYRVTYATSSNFTTGTTVIDTGSTATAKTLTGLTPGTTYFVKVAATNSVGTGTASATVSQTPAATPSAPAAPVAALTGLSTASLDWTAPAANGSTITGYTVTSSPAGPVASISGTSATISGLVAGTDYTFTVTATNAKGTSASSSSSNTITSAAVPAAPTALAVAIASSTSLTASWTTPASDNGDAITGYRVTYATSADFATATAVIDTGSTATSKTLTGLTAGTVYYIKVAATNGVGTGTASSTASKAPAAGPATPAAPVAALTGLNTASLTWTAPAFNGSTITGYTVTSSPAGAVPTIIGTSATLSDLTPGTTYTFTVKATNAFGTSSASAASNSVTAADAPSAPTGLALAIASSTSVNATWTAPVSDNGDAVFSYRVTYSTTSDFSANVQALDTGMTATSISLSALTPGTTYYVKVAATNSVGTGTASSSASKAPAAAPSAPAAPVAALTGLSTASLDWTAPAANGSVITGYTVTSSPAGPVASISGASATISGLVAGTDYTFTVKATNAFGISPASAASNTITSAAAPAAPTGLAVAISSSTSLTASWTTPASDNGDAITSYRVTYAPTSDFFTGTQVLDTGSTATTATITGLTPGTTYYVKVAATNGVGTGTATAPVSKAPSAAPGTPAAPVATLTGLTTASLDWNAPAANGSGITGYTVTSSPAGATAVVTGTAAAISGLVAGTDYTFTVKATNAQGTSAASASSNSITTAAAPAAPTGLALAIASSTSLTATWTAPSVTNGSALTSYRVTYSTSADFFTGTSVVDTGSTTATKTLTGLTPGTTYFVKVAATNAVGTGAATSASSLAPAAAPSAPAAPVATLTGLAAASLTWSAPASNGSAITGYTVTSSPAGATAVITGTTAAISGLTAGTSYTFTVTATNAIGTSAASAASNQVTAAAAPAAPTALALAIASGTSLTATWTAPAVTNGSAITSYRVTYSTSADFSTGTNVLDTGVTTASATITGLTNGTVYYVKVAATNGVGTGSATASASKAPAAAPSAPAAPVATLAGISTASLDWTAPAANGSVITGYTVTSSPAGATAVITGTTATISGLTAGTDYTFTVKAINAIGTSPASASSNQITSASVTNAPTGMTLAITSTTSLTATWNAPTLDGGSPVTSYRVTFSTVANFDANVQVIDTGSTATSYAFTGLTQGTTYYAKVAATNAVGTSAASDGAVKAPAATPDAPTFSYLTGADAAVDIQWNTPGDGSSAITSYDLQYSTDASFATDVTMVSGLNNPTNTYTATGLNAGTDYFFRVRAVNAVGAGAWSDSNPAMLQLFSGDTTTTLDGGYIYDSPWGTIQPYSLTGNFDLSNIPVGATYTMNVDGNIYTGTVRDTAYAAMYGELGITSDTNTGDEWDVSGGDPYVSLEINGMSYPNKATTNKTQKPAGLTLVSVTSTSVTVAADRWADSVTATTPATTAIRVKVTNATDPNDVRIVDVAPGVNVDQYNRDLITISGLTQGTTYLVDTASISPAGISAYYTDYYTWATLLSATPAAAPGAPTAVTAAITGGWVGTSAVSVDWSAPADNGGSPVTGYRVLVTNDANGSQLYTNVNASSTTGYLYLVAGFTYHVQVFASNGAGESVGSTSVALSTLSAPAAPYITGSSAWSATSVNVGWGPSWFDGGSPVTGYRIMYATDSAFTTGVTVIDTGSTATSRLLTGLTPGTTYYVQVAATSALGTSGYSTVTTAVPMAAPAAPTGFTVTVASGSALTASWTAPASNGSAITGYTVTYATDAAFTANVKTAATASTSVTISALANGQTYYMKVAAANAVGPGAYSASASAAPAQVPFQVTGVTLVSASPTSLTASWAVANSGGATVSSYRITYATDAAFTANVSVIDTGSTALSKTLSGLTTGTTYYAKVAATNAIGTGAYSTAVSAAPAGAPGVPTGVTVTAASQTSLNASWTAPAANGSAITGYSVQYTTDPTFTTGVTTTTTSTASKALTGLVSGTTYYVRVAATNAIGTSAYTTGVSAAPTYVTTTLAGSYQVGTSTGDGSLATASTLKQPTSIAVDNAGNYYIAESQGNKIRMVTAAGIISTLAGTGTAGMANGATGAASTFNNPTGVVLNSPASPVTLYVADKGNNQIRAITLSTGATTLLAGNSTGLAGSTDGIGAAIRFTGPYGIAINATTLYITEFTGNRVRKLTTAGVSSLLAGSSTGVAGSFDGTSATSTFNGPAGIFADTAGNVYVADSGNHKIRKVSFSGSASTVAGTGTSGSADGSAASATFNTPYGITANTASGPTTLWVTDTFNNTVRQIATSTVTTIAGTAGSSGSTNGAGAAARFNQPQGIFYNPTLSALWVADTSAYTVRKIQ